MNKTNNYSNKSLNNVSNHLNNGLNIENSITDFQHLPKFVKKCISNIDISLLHNMM